MSPFRIYADRAAMPPELPHHAALYPFYGQPRSDPRSPTSGRFDRYVELGSDLLELVALAEADLAVLPVAWEHVEGRPDAVQAARDFAEAVARAGVPLVVFYVSDSEAAVPLADAWVFRTSLRRSTRRPRELAMPALTMDVARQELGGEVVIRPWEPVPVVGFCGYAPGARFPRSARDVVDMLKLRAHVVRGDLPSSIYVRAKALRALSRSPRVQLNTLIREAFWAGAVVTGRPPDYARMTQARAEFVQNLVACDYALCARGGGNFSYRLYEALSAGRIPLFIDTDCVLPFEDEIDWRNLCVWVDEEDVGTAADAVADFHAALGPSDFEERQFECRRVWEEYLGPEGFFRHFHRQLQVEMLR